MLAVLVNLAMMLLLLGLLEVMLSALIGSGIMFAALRGLKHLRGAVRRG